MKGKIKMAVNFDYDFSGYATKANTKCYDGLTIAPNAFADDNGRTVPVVWNHNHSGPEYVLGHALLQNRRDGVYAYVKMNDTPSGQTALEAVRSGDIDAMSIFANGLKKAGQTVMHGVIRELSLVLAGCNPGALIDEIVAHGADNDGEGGEAFIYTDGGLSLKHGLDPDDNPLNEEDDEMATEGGKTLEEVVDTMNDEQKEALYALVGMAKDGLDEDDDPEEDDYDDEDNEDDYDDYDEEDDMKHNVFDNDPEQGVLRHSMDEINAAIADGRSCGSMKDAFIAHGIEDVEWLFPEDHLLDTPPRIIDNDQSWVSKVMSGVHHIPFSRVKSMAADLTEEDARAKGYIKGNFKKEQVFSLLKRSTTPTTVYKKQKMDRDDVADITGFDVIAWLKQEMRVKLNEELARAYLIGDGRLSSSDDKINEGNIRPIYNDDDLFTIKVQVETTAGDDTATKLDKMMTAVLKARKNYKGAGNPTFYTTEDILTDLRLMKDKIGHRLYKNDAEVAEALRVKEIVTVPQMENMKGVNGGEFVGLIVNLADYTVGADKGGAVNMFDDFDIDYNQQKYLIETRCSGAMTTPFGAMAIEYKVA
uniref:Major capsid protein n=1 Tax=Siphoviridae sp. ct1E017 TaxID=2827764 RepID=A0A8S5T1C4_9CAUD|nr:MAG TPA: major capsid protein [Siphoviridae sp. ct1E017]